MTKDEILRNACTPIAGSPIPPVKHRFLRREYMYIYYRTDAEAFRKALPEPLEMSEGPIVRFEMMKMPDVTGFGSYTECGQALECSFGGEKGEYLHMMFLDNFDAIAAGREVHAYPKKLGYPQCFCDENTLVGILDYGRDFKMRIANATMDYKYFPMAPEDALARLTAPVFMLKIQPDYTGKQRVCELTRTVTPAENIEIREAYTGDARLQLFDHVKCPMADLPVKEIVGAEHIICDISLGRPEKLYDYLA